MTVEAKSAQKSTGMLSMDYVRQSTTQLQMLAADRDVEAPPESNVPIIVSPLRTGRPDALPIAEPHVYRATPKSVLDIGHDAVRARKELRDIARGVGRRLAR
ncbi:hypothetical protein [Amycolatopsis thailandensis]|uniref:hypothetical protein n=1 Tax=Amycolatopsis thailandensis TaxID=589330 RepID=UPI003634A138